MIELRNICFAYDETPILKHFDLTVGEGEFVVIKGDNGCGKSTLLNIINALDFAQIGEYSFNGNAITQKAMQNDSFSKAFHQKIGYVFQNTDAQLFCASVEEEIAFGPTQMGLTQSEITERVEDMLELLGVLHLRQRAPYHLSMGEKKKIALGAVLAVNPEVLILDEPMNFLDKKSRLWIKEFLQSLKGVKTIIIVSHTDDFNEMADKIIEM